MTNADKELVWWTAYNMCKHLVVSSALTSKEGGKLTLTTKLMIDDSAQNLNDVLCSTCISGCTIKQ